ncbi:hypothetical protein PLICRDRAFT_36305 [Plicaturopsis crispa FD-325 SS-3]|nr:hypothetical protein PLICRDRAFT_36305 [Plicaturopsis crispa FD-325 SS-3]
MVIADDGDDRRSDEPTPPVSSCPPRKRQKMKVTDDAEKIIAAKNIRISRGKLAKMTDMPMDILFDIFGHLHPLDLLHLCRTTKLLRSIIMHRSSRSIWKAALATVEGLPGCPPDLQEPEYTRLAFDPRCHYCLAPGVTTIRWACRVRCCGKCIKTQFVTEGWVYQNLFLPTHYGQGDYKKLLPRSVLKHGRWSQGKIVCRSDFDILCRRVSELDGDGKGLDTYLEERKALTGTLEKHGESCAEWHKITLASRTTELEGTRARRRQAIFDNLTELGWGDEIAKNQAYNDNVLINHPLVKQPKDLTKRIWTNMKDVMVAFMEELKTQRLAREQLQIRFDRQAILSRLLEEYKKTRPSDEIVPRAADVCAMETFKTLIEAPITTEIRESTFSEGIACLPRLSDEWRQSISQKLLELIPRDGRMSDDAHPDLAALDLATTYFQCHVCEKPIRFPDVLAHHCLTSLYAVYNDNDESEITKRLFRLSCEPWNYGRIPRVRACPRASQTAREIVGLCGRDPATTTALDMDRLDAKFSCGICKGRHVHVAVTWDRAIFHATRLHPLNAASNWTLSSAP